jgi:hypothetical protein
MYRAPSGNIYQFVDLLDDVLKCLHHLLSISILCGDINANYLTENNNKIKLAMKMNAYNLEKVEDFPVRIFNDKIPQLDNIFLDKAKRTAFQFVP